MSLSAPPFRGYNDWQRIGNYDTGVIWSQQGSNVSGPFQSPILDVSRFARLGGVFQCALAQYQVTVSYYADTGALTPVGTRAWMVSNLIPDYCFPLLISLGPFARITIANPAGGNYSYSVAVVATNRTSPLEFIPINPVLATGQNIGLATGTLLVYPLDYYAGPVSVWTDAQAAGQVLAIQALDISNNWDFVQQAAFGVSPGTITQMVTPPGAWRLSITNPGVATGGNYYAVVASTTGST